MLRTKATWGGKEPEQVCVCVGVWVSVQCKCPLMCKAGRRFDEAVSQVVTKVGCLQGFDIIPGVGVWRCQEIVFVRVSVWVIFVPCTVCT